MAMKNQLPYLFCLSRMKLRMPAGLEKSEMKEKVSPMTGQPIVPGMSLISFEELRDLNQRSPAHATAMAASTGAPKIAMAESRKLKELRRQISSEHVVGVRSLFI